MINECVAMCVRVSVCVCMHVYHDVCVLFCVAGLSIYSGCRHDPQSLVCLASMVEMVPGKYMAMRVCTYVYLYA